MTDNRTKVEKQKDKSRKTEGQNDRQKDKMTDRRTKVEKQQDKSRKTEGQNDRQKDKSRKTGGQKQREG